METVTPMMQQYLDIKEDYQDAIVLFRLGDFYEMFFDDAIKASKELEITLTGRDCGLSERAPMCGVPFHSVDGYISRLVSKGYKVAICEQVEDPKDAVGIVRRDVIRVITPGTIIDTNALDDTSNNYLCSLYFENDGAGMTFADITTGELYTIQIDGSNIENVIINELSKYMPKEIIVNNYLVEQKNLLEEITERLKPSIEIMQDPVYGEEYVKEQISSKFSSENLSEYDLFNKQFALKSLNACIEYIKITQKGDLEHVKKVNFYTANQFMEIDISTKRNLEITQTMLEKSKVGSLLWVLDYTNTPMGGRLIKNWLEMPSVLPTVITKRLEAVRELVSNSQKRDELIKDLKNITDVERLLSKISTGSANARDLISIKNSISYLPSIVEKLNDVSSNLLTELHNTDTLNEVFDIIDSSIVEEPPFTVREGGMIKDHYSEEVDDLRRVINEGQQWIAQIEQDEREKTGIKNLKIAYNKVFGYYIEVTKSYLNLVPEHYIRKQTLANCERYITEKLKELESLMLSAEDKITKIEYELFQQIKDKISEHTVKIQQTARNIATLDVLLSFATAAKKNNYIEPNITLDNTIEIKNGRHPVIEKMLKNALFVPNDTLLNLTDEKFGIITGPNMAGKSTYMRQVALIVLMAQIGSFVPSEYAKISIVDKLFTRVGAYDDLSRGQSTFMVEMTEVANILNNATKNSLIILDEIGRGTSTYDGLSIAWAVVEHISEKIGAKTLFATHYHELTELENKIPGVKNYCISAKKRGNNIIFLRKIIRGGADESYGVEVAQLAGVPSKVIVRAREILQVLELNDINKEHVGVNIKSPTDQNDENQMGFGNITSNEIIEELKITDVNTFTPIEAMTKLYELTIKAKKY